ncbi:hypothetical protein GCM10022226_53250 [Sphaerisporangium flaviroseum]|uniref:Uncharacterized protein n=1 Tax=Sphaerisporangium flaviroseum TaxID=509199 RepID=A0ABP7ISH6_9ACTN
MAMRERHEIPDEEHEQIFQRVGAIDVAKDSGKVCMRVPYESRPGRRLSKVWDVDATFNAVAELGKKARNHIRQLEALGFTVTLTQAA